MFLYSFCLNSSLSLSKSILRSAHILTAPYRDDNRYFWAFDGFDIERSIAAGYEPPQQLRKQVNLMEFVNELEVEGAGEDAQEVWVLGTELFPYEDLGVSFNESEGLDPTVGPVLLSALIAQDMYLAGTIVLLLGALTVFGTFVSDLVLMWIDPRIRHQVDQA